MAKALIQKLIVSGILHKMIVPGIWFIMRPLNVYQQLEHRVMKSPLLELGSHVSLRDANGEINPTVLYIDVMLHDEDTISSVISLYSPSVYLTPPICISTSLALFLSIMNTPDAISLLRTLSKIISDGVDKIDQSCTQLQLQFPSLDEPFTPTNHAPHLDPQISEAVSIIVAAAAQITAIAQPAPVSLLTSALQVCGLLELCKIN